MSSDLNKLELINDFDEFGLKINLLRGIYKYGFEKPSLIQSKVIKPFITGRDLLAQSHSGSGKTATFTIGTLQKIDENIKSCQAIILANTRELALQIYHIVLQFSKFMDINISLCIGGTNIQKSVKELKKGSQLIIGTPGRVKSMIEKKNISVEHLKLIVLDEADELLSESFEDEIRYIIKSSFSDTQICLFSATMQKDKIKLSKNFLNNPLILLIHPEKLTLDCIKQFYISLSEESWKFDVLCSIYNMISISQSIIYVNGSKKAEWLKNKLIEKNFTVSVIYGSMSLIDRTKVMDNFRQGDIRILITTDLLGRGIDIEQVSIVLNYDVPRNKSSYIHRIGRTGRFGKKGVAINFATEKEMKLIDDLKKYYSTEIEPMPQDIKKYL